MHVQSRAFNSYDLISDAPDTQPIMTSAAAAADHVDDEDDDDAGYLKPAAFCGDYWRVDQFENMSVNYANNY